MNYVRSLLDVTDNLVDGTVVRPPGVRVHDEDDTYLVVAADKGTATLSDTANRISREYGFWLDDAFASGGSAGYDHKKLGITARGAWESVKRHFHELGMDPAVDEFTAVGIGDMSGDVFGNGMLLSDKIRLVAAYDHRHIFIDPSPDAAGSFEERRRLFELAGSSWDDYDRSLISAGGGVWPRSAKSIQLSEEARAALGTDSVRLAPTEVIQAILRAPVDLLWNGGIGTVVKASYETDADAQDRASDAIRVDARELRARVVGEGGNLGLTRLARVEFASRGGHINADFIDNSAGVDCSDHEVNLKILLGLAETRGDMTREQRDELLVEVTDDVVAHVLYDSFLQAQIIGQEVERSAARLYAYEDLMGMLEEQGMLDRASEDLPDAEEIAERRRAGRGMERPELSVLVAYAKRWVARALEKSSFIDDPWLERDLRAYFPPAVVERCGDLLTEHPLRRQLLCMSGSNSVVNALGPTFVSQLVMERGCDAAEVVRAYRIARAVTGAAARWDAIERLDDLDPAVHAELMTGGDAVVESATRWYLAWEPEGAMETVVVGGPRGAPAAGRGAAGAGHARSGGSAATRSPPGWCRRACRRRSRGCTRCAPSSRTRRTWWPWRPRRSATSWTSPRSSSRSAPSCASTGWRPSSNGSAPSSRMQRWALQAVREDALHARQALAETALRESPGALAGRGGRALPPHARRGDPPAGVLHARAGPRGRAGPRRPHAGRSPAQDAGLLARTYSCTTRLGAAIDHASSTRSRISGTSIASIRTSSHWYLRSTPVGIRNFSGSASTAAARHSRGNPKPMIPSPRSNATNTIRPT